MSHALLIHAGALGDFILALRVVAALHRTGATRVTVLGRPAIAALAVGRAGVDAAIDIDTGGFHMLTVPVGDLSPWVRECLVGVDLTVNMLAGGIQAARLRSAGVKRIIDLDPRPIPGDTRHITDQWLAHLAGQKMDTAVGPSRLVMPQHELAAARAEWDGWLGGSHSPPVVIHPGSGGRHKCWPADRFVTLARRVRDGGRAVAFLFGHVEMERMSRADLEALRLEFPCVEDQPLERVAALLATANLFIGNDSGVAHLAAAVGTSTVAVFGPTDARVWSPLGPRVRAVASSNGEWPTVDDVHAKMPET